jgi:hypothetical protein
LGWAPDVALRTPVSHILLALEGKQEYLRISNPFMGSEKEEGGLSPATTDDHIRTMFNAIGTVKCQPASGK